MDATYAVNARSAVDAMAGIWITGIGATVFMDVWSLVRRGVFGVATPDYALVGRWLGHMKHGKFMHVAIKNSPRIQREVLIGWMAHYLQVWSMQVY